MTAAKQAAGQGLSVSRNASANAAQMLRKRAENGLETPAQRPERLCACGCGACFVPRNNTQLYVNAQHRQQRFIEDKKTATHAFVHALVWVYSNFNEAVADRIAQETVDFHFTARCKVLERAGWKYNSEARAWGYVG